LYCNVTEAGDATAAFWDQTSVEQPQSSNLTLTCSVVGLDRYDTVRVVHSYGAKTLLLTDNNAVGPIFTRLSRYHVSYSYSDNTALVTVHSSGTAAGRFQLPPQRSETVCRMTSYIFCISLYLLPPTEDFVCLVFRL